LWFTRYSGRMSSAVTSPSFTDLTTRKCTVLRLKSAGLSTGLLKSGSPFSSLLRQNRPGSAFLSPDLNFSLA
jgi:hypothetical protein